MKLSLFQFQWKRNGVPAYAIWAALDCGPRYEISGAN
jgi:hypothetical protein